MYEFAERLKGIEVQVGNQGKQLDKVLSLLDRMVRVEERQIELASAQNRQEELHKSEIDRLRDKIHDHEISCSEKLRIQGEELNQWKTGRKIIMWVVGSASGIGIILTLLKT